MSVTLGECQLQTPYAKIGLVFASDGRVLLLCDHDQTHGVEPWLVRFPTKKEEGAEP